MLKKFFASLVIIGLAFPFGIEAATSTRSLTGVISGKKKSVTVNVDSDTYNYIYNVPRLSCTDIPGCSSITERDQRIINEATQKAALAPLVAAIRAKTKKADDQARLAISLVQKIPYDTAKSDAIERGEDTHFRYPYEAIYDNQQICGESSYLIAFLLAELGYAAGVFVFPEAGHDTAAIKCPMKYSYKSTGYCFIESTYRNIITYDTMATRYSSDYIFEELAPAGREFSPKKDYKDAQSLKKFYAKWNKLSKKDRKKYNKIKKKYGL
ncbi:MAG: hypothetical protein V1690_02310 [Candidatus Moraniibacteriota bacterium]